MSFAIHYGHVFRGKHRDASIQLEDTKAVVWMKMNVLLNYPAGEPDTLEIAKRGSENWVGVPVVGNNFPGGFIEAMGGLQTRAKSSIAPLSSHSKDAYRTMQRVETLYESSATLPTCTSYK